MHNATLYYVHEVKFNAKMYKVKVHLDQSLGFTNLYADF